MSSDTPYKIEKSTEQGFDISTGFQDMYDSMPEELKVNRDYYFSSYSNTGIHEEMLRDFERTSAYRTAIIRNKHLFKDKIVLDVGCGTSILSLFAAKAGAKHVYAIDMASITIQAKQIIKENGLEDKITVLNGKMEELVLPVDKVDIIISEWMGYCLLYESMLDSVLWARDKYLADDGMIFPDRAKIFIATMDDPDFYANKSSYWDDVYGISMKNMKDKVLREGFVDFMNVDVLNSAPALIADINLETVKIEELDFCSGFDLKINRYTATNGFVVWFDTDFTHGVETVVLSTSKHLLLS